MLVTVCGSVWNPRADAQSGLTDISASLKEVPTDSAPVRVTVIDGYDIRFSRLSTSAGLSQTRVAQIVQDDRGFMWFGTQYGLNRYDGYKFKVFTPDPARPDSISSAYIYALFKDRDGMIWIGCGQNVDRLDPSTESFTHYRLDPNESHPQPRVVRISQDRNRILWLSTAKGLYGLDPVTGRVTQHYSHDPLNPLSLSSNDVRSTGEDRGGRFWVADGSTLEQLDRKTGNVRLRVTLPSSPREFSFYEDNSGLLWICYSGGIGVASLNPGSGELTRYVFYAERSNKSLGTSVFAVVQDKDGVLWLGTQGTGLLRFDREHRTAVCYRNHANDPKSLTEDRIIALNQDREGNIWVGMHASEPNVFSTKKPSFRPLLSEDVNPNNMGEHFVNSIYEDRRGILWVATTGALLGIDRKTGRRRFYSPPGGLNNDIVAMTEDSLGTLWVGTIGRGLNRFDPDTGRFIAYLHDPAVPSSISNNAVDHLFIDHLGTIWVGTWDGLNRFDSATGRFIVYKRDWTSRSEYVHGIAEDQDGNLWLGGTSGLQRFDPRTGKFTAYQHKIEDPSSISDDRVMLVHVDHAGAIWVASDNGLNRLDPQTGKFTKYYVRDGLPSNRLACIQQDRSGHLWISTTSGLSEFDPLTNLFKNYSVNDGLPGMDLTGWSACAASRTGEMYFGGFSGGTAFYPNKIADSTFVPPVVFTDFQVAGVSVGVGGGSPLNRSISYSKSVTLSHTQTAFTLEFAALSYSNQATNRYRYRLEPLDSTWHEVRSGQRLVSYNRLPAGEYTFRAQAATNRGPWSDPGASLRIEILPPWWNTVWFRSICVVLVLLSLWAAHSYRIGQMVRQFEVRVEERVSERTRIARELHDTLLQSFQGLIIRLQAVSDLLPEGKAKDQLERSLERADQAIAEGRSTVYELRSSATTANDLAEAVRALGEELTTQDSAVFHLVVEGPSRDLHPIVRDEIYRIACEGLRNAFGHARANRIETEITYGPRLFQLRIRDDGKGIPTSILEEGRPGHYGLSGMRERARQLNGKLEIWSGARAGTEIELSVAGTIAYNASPGRSLFHLFRRKTG